MTDVPRKCDEVNAAFIVRAVNAHDELVAACKKLVAAIRAKEEDGYHDTPAVWKQMTEAEDAGAAALAKAEEPT